MTSVPGGQTRTKTKLDKGHRDGTVPEPLAQIGIQVYSVLF